MLIFSLDFPGDSAVKNSPAKRETQAPSLGREDPLEKEMATHSRPCLENPTDRGAWWATITKIILLSHKRVGHNLVTKLQHEMFNLHAMKWF